MRLTLFCAIAFVVGTLPFYASAQDTAVTRAADGFELPVGPNGTGEGYYIARGYRPNGHLGEDWNGVKGGDTDLGDPVYAIANGYVMFARNYHVGWGNVVILRHAYYEGSTLKYCDSLYGHLLDFSVQEGEQVRRGQKIGRIGNNFGMYEAHLHLEMRKNLQIGMFRSSFLRDFSNYYTPNEFIAAHRACPSGNHMVSIPINTYPPVAPPILAGPHVESPMSGPPRPGAPPRFARVNPLPPLAPAPSAPPPPPAKVITKAATPTPAPATPEPRIAKSQATAPTPAPASTAKKSSKKNSSDTTAIAAASPTPSPKRKGSAGPPAVADAPRATPTPATAGAKTRKASPATPQPAVVTRLDSDTIASDPLFPQQPISPSPIRRAGSGYKVDRFEDLRGKKGY